MIDGYKDNWYALLICVLKKKSAAEAGAIMKLCGYKKLLRENRRTV